MSIGKTCPKCRHIHPSDLVSVVGRFRPNGTMGFYDRGADVLHVYGTRWEAEDAACVRLAGKR